MDIAEIEQALIGLLRKYAPADRGVTPATDLVGDLGLESVRILEFVVDVEDHFDLIIDIERLSEVHTVRDMARVVQQLQAG